ncbi:MAG: CARDB domain-containing protein, partial [Verrucomicrobiales bacterium]
MSGSLVGSNVRQIFPGPGASGNSVPVETILNAPPDTPSGSYRLIVTIDPDEARTDCDRSNNTFQIGGTLTVLPAPDLGFLSSTSINVSGTNVLLGAGESFTINLSYRNAGGLINIPAFPIDYYLVPENRIYSGGFQYGAADVVFLGRRTAPGLTASQQVTSQFWATTSQAFSLPADLTLTNDRVGARLDPDNAVHEVGDEKNDLASEATENIGVLYIIERPDYTSGGSSFISFSTNSAPAGNFVTFSGRVLNSSPFTNPNITTIRHFLRRGNAGIPIPIGVSLMPPVAAIGFHDFSAALQIPADLYPDDYTYLFQIDDAEVVPERDETNNQGVFFGTELEVTPPVRPDIVAEGGQFTPQGIQPGGTLTIQADLENAGFSATGSFSARFFLSSDTTVGDADDITLGTRTIASGLSAGASATFTPSLTIPANTPYGQYRVGWVLDSNGQVEELSEVNNTVLLSSPLLTVSPSGGPLLPDLRPLSATPNPNRADFAEDLSLSVIVRNDGAASASGVVCAAWLSVDDIAGNADDFALGSVNLGTIGASAQKAGTINGAMPKAPYPVGMCRLILEADPSGGIAESDETNNVVVTAPVLQLLPSGSDLHPLLQIGQQSVSPAVCLPGQSIETFALVRNVGGSSAGGVVTRLVLSLDGSLGNADDILLREFGPDTLPVSSGGTVFSASVSLPDTIAPGAY